MTRGCEALAAEIADLRACEVFRPRVAPDIGGPLVVARLLNERKAIRNDNGLAYYSLIATTGTHLYAFSARSVIFGFRPRRQIWSHCLDLLDRRRVPAVDSFGRVGPEFGLIVTHRESGEVLANIQAVAWSKDADRLLSIIC
jgi:hypothetical protein